MMGYTDRHFRYFLRLISRHIFLYTEMITTGAILHGDRDYLLAYDPIEHPLALQLGGSDPFALAQCAKVAEEYGYDAVNLNVGCPSDRVQGGHFGACLMKEPELVAECVAQMRAATNIPISVKCRIGVDERDSYEELVAFIKMLSEAGCQTFIIHARKAWLKGLSPKENREIPPLRYEVVHQIKQDFPQLRIIINGGLKSLSDMQQQVCRVDGVMIGREAYQNPYALAQVDEIFYGAESLAPSRLEVINQFLPYVEQQLKHTVRLSQITRYILGLFHGVSGAQVWRRHLSENAHQANAGVDVIQDAMRLINNHF
jgi:tRNA-dihydrouridine synthase A